MLKPEKVVRFYAYTTKLHIDDMAETLMMFDDVHVEPPKGLPGVKPQEDLETKDLDAYEEMIRTLERASALTGISLEEVLEEALSVPSEATDYKEMISELDDVVGKYLSAKKELELARKAKSLLKEKTRRAEELEEKLEELEMKIKEYYSAALEITEEDPAKFRLGRMLLEADRELLRISSLINAALDPSMSLDDIREVLKNAMESLSSLGKRISMIRDELEGSEKADIVEEIKLNLSDLKEVLEGLMAEIDGYMTGRDKLSELKAVEGLWNKMRDTVKRVPELSPLLAEREPAIAKVTQQISELEEDLSRRESSIRGKLQSTKTPIAQARGRFIQLRDELLTIKAVAAGEAEQRVSELIEGAKPIISERGKLKEEIDRLKLLSNKEEVKKLDEEADKLFHQAKEIAVKLASLALSIKSRAILQKLKKMTYVGEQIAVISGWIPSSKVEEFETSIKGKLGNYVAIELEEPKSVEGVPSKVRLPSILRPVRLLTHRLYGLPTIRELDPTPITAIFFPLMFGMMFGDVGHGLTLALLGVLLWGRSRGAMKELAGLMIYSGIAAAFFGYLYGMFYFVEFTKPVLSPLTDTRRLMAVALLFGAFELMVGFAINTVNKLLEGDLFAALFEYKGVATLIMYAGAVYAVVRNNAAVMSTIADPLFRSMVVPLLITMVAPIIRCMREGHGIGEGASEMIATFLESVLALFSNSLSYIRLAAFAVIHEVFGVLTAQLILGKEIVTLADLGPLLAPGALLGFIFMNIAVMGLEGVLSFIQATRLTFYEFFSKFYKATGREFRRVSELLEPSSFR